MDSVGSTKTPQTQESTANHHCRGRLGIATTLKPKTQRGTSLDTETHRQMLKLQKHAFYFLITATALILSSVIIALFFQGFALKGFKLPANLLYILTGAGIAKLAAAFYFIIRVLFGRQVSPNRPGP